MKNFSIKMIAVCMFLVLLFLSGCTERQEPKTILPKDKDMVVLAAARHLAPGKDDAYYCSKILFVWEPLITRTDNGMPAPCLATSWEMLNGGKEWIFHLRKNVRFHDGSLFNADAVIKNFDRLKYGMRLSNYYYLDKDVFYPKMTNYEKLDDYTIRLTFSEPSVNQLHKMVDFGSPIFAPSCLDEKGNFKGIAIGTGPYKIERNELEKYVILVRNDDYYGEKGKIKRFMIKNIPNPDVRFSALKAQEILGVTDMNALTSALADQLNKDKQFKIAVNKSTIIRYLYVNGGRYPFNDVRMRQAVSLIIDRDELVNGFFLGYAKATGNILNYTSPYYLDLPYEYNKKKAQALAHEVLCDKRQKVTFLISDMDNFQKGEAELIAYWLKDIGLDVNLHALEGGVAGKLKRKGEYDIAFGLQGLPNGDAYSFLSRYALPDGPLNISSSSHYKNIKVERLLEKAKYTSSEEEKHTLFDEVQKILAVELPVIPLFNDMNIVAYNKRLKNYKPLIYGVDLSKVELAEEND